MKILQVISSVNPKGGGPAEVLLQQNRDFLAQGHRVAVVSLDAPQADYLASYAYPIYPLGPRWGSYAFSAKLVPWLKDNYTTFDCVILHGLWQYPGLAVWRVLHQSQTPYFVFTHGMLDPWFKVHYPLKHLKKWLYWPWAEYRILRDAQAVLFTTEEERLLARRSFWLYRCREHVINCGIARQDGNATQQKNLFLAAFPQTVEKRNLLYLSRIHPKKGGDLLIKAFAQVCKQDSELHLIIAGPDQVGWQTKLVALATNLGISERITWTGMLSGDLKWGAYHSAEAFILPSHQENFGVVVAEALACGLPVLISKKVNIWREIAAAQAGLVQNDDLAGTVALLTEWLQLAKLETNQFRQRALQCFEQYFEASKTAQYLVDFLHSIIKRSS